MLIELLASGRSEPRSCRCLIGSSVGCSSSRGPVALSKKSVVGIATRETTTLTAADPFLATDCRIADTSRSRDGTWWSNGENARASLAGENSCGSAPETSDSDVDAANFDDNPVIRKCRPMGTFTSRKSRSGSQKACLSSSSSDTHAASASQENSPWWPWMLFAESALMGNQWCPLPSASREPLNAHGEAPGLPAPPPPLGSIPSPRTAFTNRKLVTHTSSEQLAPPAASSKESSQQWRAGRKLETVAARILGWLCRTQIWLRSMLSEVDSISRKRRTKQPRRTFGRISRDPSVELTTPTVAVISTSCVAATAPTAHEMAAAAKIDCCHCILLIAPAMTQMMGAMMQRLSLPSLLLLCTINSKQNG